MTTLYLTGIVPLHLTGNGFSCLEYSNVSLKSLADTICLSRQYTATRGSPSAEYISVSFSSIHSWSRTYLGLTSIIFSTKRIPYGDMYPANTLSLMLCSLENLSRSGCSLRTHLPTPSAIVCSSINASSFKS